MTTTRARGRWAAGLAILAALSLPACGDNSKDDVTNPPVDDSSTTPPEESDNASEQDTGGEVDQ